MIDNNTPFDMVILSHRMAEKSHWSLVMIHQINAKKVPETFASRVFPSDVTERMQVHMGVV